MIWSCHLRTAILKSVTYEVKCVYEVCNTSELQIICDLCHYTNLPAILPCYTRVESVLLWAVCLVISIIIVLV